MGKKILNTLGDFLTSDTDKAYEDFLEGQLNMMSQPAYKLELVKKEIESVGLEQIIDYIGVEKFENIIRKKKFNKLLDGKKK